jgi:hypothetical protein
MSKMDGLRAMREAKFAANARRSASAGTPAAKKPAPVAPSTRAASKAPAVSPAPAAGEDAATDALCGHRNMSGRSCTREAGHAAKSHRYS